MFISVCVIALNEEKAINTILQDIEAQDYDHNNMEVLLVDSGSKDMTRSYMEDFVKRNKEKSESLQFRDVKLLDNPGKVLPCGWNVALGAYQGEAILKVDAHASIPKDFIRKNVETLESGEDVCGGLRPNVLDEPTLWKKTLLLAESSMFGASIAPYRNNPGKTYVKSIFHGAYRRKVFDTIGKFNEALVRTEDNEIHYRIRKAGFKICFNPEIISYQQIRSSLRKMIKQKYANGYWIGLTCGVCPQCFSLYHFVPFAFVVAILLSTLLCVIFGGIQAGVGLAGLALGLYKVIVVLTGVMWAAYWLLAIFMSVIAVIGARKERNITNVALPFLFFLLHISYGIGTMIGFIKMPSWAKGIKDGRDKER
jgi:glycosyltransferase involved in cell wall biosynthesis